MCVCVCVCVCVIMCVFVCVRVCVCSTVLNNTEIVKSVCNQKWNTFSIRERVGICRFFH